MLVINDLNVYVIYNSSRCVVKSGLSYSSCLNSYQYFHFKTIDLTPPTVLPAIRFRTIINLLEYQNIGSKPTFISSHLINKINTNAHSANIKLAKRVGIGNAR